jgi:O-antigen/teichoic acid export membrane protein
VARISNLPESGGTTTRLASFADALAYIELPDPASTNKRVSRPGRGFTFLIGGQLAAKLARFIAAVVLARELSLSSYGLVNVGIAVSGVTVMAATLGLNELGVRDVAVEPQRLQWIAGRVLAARLLGVLTITLVLAFAAVVGDPSILPVLTIVTLMSLSTASSSEWLLRGMERMGSLGLAETIGGVVVMTGCLLLAFTGTTSVLALSVFALGEAVSAGACWIAAGRSSLPRIGLEGLNAMIRRSWPIGISAIAFYTYYANIDTIILAATRSEREAGLYTAAYRLFLAANLVGIVAAYVQLPILSRAVADGDDVAASASLRRALYFLACYGAVIVGGAEIGGQAVLGILFGQRFTSMAPVFTLLCMGIAWYAVGFPAGYTLIARGQNKRLLAGSATAAVLNISLNVALIPLVGPIGAATATFVAFLAASIVWLHAHAMLDRAGLKMVAALTAVSIGGFAVLVSPVTRLPVGISTILIATLVAGNGWRQMPPASRQLASLFR